MRGPGFNWSWPYPIDEVVRIPISEIQKVTSTTGWYFTTPDQEFNNVEPPAGPSLNPAQDGYVITGDTNIIHGKVTLHYRIEDPIRFVFEFKNASNAVQSSLDNALIYVAAQYKVDDVLRHDRTGFQERVQARVAFLVGQQKLGITIDQCRVDTVPPRQVKAAFERVNNALSARDKARNDALSYSNQIVSRAESEAVNRTSSAQTERVRLVETVRAEAERFTNSLPQYRRNAGLFTSLQLNETLGRVLTNVEAKWYLPERSDGKSQELRLLLSREPLKPASAQNQ